MEMSIDSIDPVEGLIMTHNGYTKAQQMMGMKGVRKFIPPHTVRYASRKLSLGLPRLAGLVRDYVKVACGLLVQK